MMMQIKREKEKEKERYQHHPIFDKTEC